mgnify:CR=1 FL=1
MMDWIRKDLPLKSMITVYEKTIDDKKMDKDIIKVIDEYGDRQNHITNVKAQMTEWHMYKEPGFNKLANIVLRLIPEITKDKFSIKDFKPKVAEMWGMKYKSGEIAIEHDHWPCAWSGVYYLKGPKDSPGLFFPEMGDQGGERTFETGLLIMFPGHVRHAVRSKKFKGSRYVVAFNVHQHKGNDIYTLLD